MKGVKKTTLGYLSYLHCYLSVFVFFFPKDGLWNGCSDTGVANCLIRELNLSGLSCDSPCYTVLFGRSLQIRLGFSFPGELLSVQ